MVDRPSQVHNVDFSPAAIDLGRSKDVELHSRQDDDPDATKLMQWTCVNSLATGDILKVVESSCSGMRLHSLVIDKSTSDSIACSGDIHSDLALVATSHGFSITHTNNQVSVDPLQLPVIHLAILAPPGTGRWMSVSYSSDRFPFLTRPPPGQTPQTNTIRSGVRQLACLDPCIFWIIDRKWPIEIEEEMNGAISVHKPIIDHCVYILVRTNVELNYHVK